MNNTTDIAKRKVVTTSWWQGLSEQQRRLISNLAIGLGISLVSAVVIYFGASFVKNQFAKRETNQSFGGDKHATWANQLHNAINNNGLWLGTDVVSLRRTMRAIPSQQDFDKVQKSYMKQFNSSLAGDLRGDLSTTEYDEMMAIKNSKPLKVKDAQEGVAIYDPLGWAIRFNAAFNYSTWGFMWGTDEDAITAVITEIPTQQAFLDTVQVYQDQYGVSLLQDWAGEQYASEIKQHLLNIKRKPKS